jgi:hypothetical protein
MGLSGRPTPAAYNERMLRPLAHPDARSVLLGTLLMACLCAPSRADDAPTRPEPRVQKTVIDEGGTRIEELNERGAVRRIKVQPRSSSGLPGYEVLPGDAASSTAEGPANARGAAGKRVWSLLSF